MKKVIFFSTLILSLLLQSCKKPVTGCTNDKALNYNWQAEEDDYTCTFEVSGVFYHKEAFSQNLLDDGVNEINYYVNSELIGSKLPNAHFTYIPDCGNTEAIGFSRNIGTALSKNFNYILRDQNGFSLDQGNFTINGGDCLAIENN